MAKTSVADLGDSELIDELGRQRQELFALRFKLATGSLETTHKIQQHKRQIARVLTELREREIAAAEEEATN